MTFRKLLLGIPTAGAPSTPFIESLANVEMPAGEIAFDRFLAVGNFVPAQRQLIVERALELGADALLMCDDDMVLPPGAFARLLGVLEEQPRCALAGALYYSRDGFRPMAVDRWDPHDTTTAVIPAFDDRTPVCAGGVGFGCVAIRMQAVLELEPPYFPAHVFIERSTARVRVCDEDYLFCHRLHARGWDVVLHPGVRCGHYDRASGTVAPSHWEPPEITNRPRVCVRHDGVTQLVDASANAPSIPETHTPANVSYIIVP